jgi:hypothetical protein
VLFIGVELNGQKVTENSFPSLFSPKIPGKHILQTLTSSIMILNNLKRGKKPSKST